MRGAPHTTTESGRGVPRSQRRCRAKLARPQPAASQDDKVGVCILGKPNYLLVRIADRKMGVANLDSLGSLRLRARSSRKAST